MNQKVITKIKSIEYKLKKYCLFDNGQILVDSNYNGAEGPYYKIALNNIEELLFLANEFKDAYENYRTFK